MADETVLDAMLFYFNTTIRCAIRAGTASAPVFALPALRRSPWRDAMAGHSRGGLVPRSRTDF